MPLCLMMCLKVRMDLTHEARAMVMTCVRVYMCLADFPTRMTKSCIQNNQTVKNAGVFVPTHRFSRIHVFV